MASSFSRSTGLSLNVLQEYRSRASFKNSIVISPFLFKSLLVYHNRYG